MKGEINIFGYIKIQTFNRVNRKMINLENIYKLDNRELI